ncbi:hypothetical protein EJB05_06080, partial [Eragrostis curvula]
MANSRWWGLQIRPSAREEFPPPARTLQDSIPLNPVPPQSERGSPNPSSCSPAPHPSPLRSRRRDSSSSSTSMHATAMQAIGSTGHGYLLLSGVCPGREELRRPSSPARVPSLSRPPHQQGAGLQSWPSSPPAKAACPSSCVVRPRSGFPQLATPMAAPLSAARKKMDRSWIRGVTKFSKPHVDGVREFMRFVSERFDKNEQILCPCCKCLNHIRKHQRDVEDHLYIHGMACTYDTWIYHGESLDAGINENVGHLDALSRRQASGSLYESGNAEDIKQGIVDKAMQGSEKVPSNTLTRNVTMPSGGKVSKRVVALEEEDQPARMTRQRTGELASTEEDHHERTTIPQEGSAEDATVAYNCQPNAMAHGRNRGRRGKDLDRITQGLGAKFPVHIAEGKKYLCKLQSSHLRAG